MTNENTKPVDSKLLFLEKATWKKGQEIITVLLADENGKRFRVGHIYLDYQDNKKVFISCDSKGQEQFPPAENLYELKKQYRGAEQELAQMVKALKIDKTRSKGDGTGREIGR